MMNHFFALLILLGMIFGLYGATREAASLGPAEVRRERWEARRDEALKERERLTQAALTQGRLPDPLSLAQITEEPPLLLLPDGQRLTPDSFNPTAREMRRARWERLKKMGASLTLSAVDAPKLAVELCLEYIGIMALWLGIMRVADRAGLVATLARALSPILRRVFPDVPPNHPAMSSMLMNISANMLGLDNAATPLGLKAMKDLQELNARGDTASNSMVMFLAINTSSVTLLPFGVVGWRAASGSLNPSEFVMAALLATACSTLGAIFLTPLWAKFWPPPPPLPTEPAEAAAADPAGEEARP